MPLLQEFRRWGADLNSVIYQGDKESRTLIRNYEFYAEGKFPLFDALVTSYDLAMLDNSTLQKFKWSCIIGEYPILISPYMRTLIGGY